MICISPWQTEDGKERRCGTCLPCVMSKAAQWTLRILLEAQTHKSCSTFITLTYGPAYIPENASLSKTDVQLFLMRLRTSISRLSTTERLKYGIEAASPRYYFVGEYGDQSNRPHYHAVLFGLDLRSLPILEKAWSNPDTGEPLGFCTASGLEYERAAYVARYTQKKSFWPQRPSDGRAPEFSLMSKRPGLGRGALQNLAVTLDLHRRKHPGPTTGNIRLGANMESLWLNGVPESIRYNGRIFPLGRYLTSELCNLLKIPAPGDPQWKQHSDENLSISEKVDLMEKADVKSQGIQRRQEMRRQI